MNTIFFFISTILLSITLKKTKHNSWIREHCLHIEAWLVTKISRRIMKRSFYVLSGMAVCILSPCIFLISSFNVSVINWCCLTRGIPLNSTVSTLISYIAPHPPEMSTTVTLVAWQMYDRNMWIKLNTTVEPQIADAECVLESILWLPPWSEILMFRLAEVHYETNGFCLVRTTGVITAEKQK